MRPDDVPRQRGKTREVVDALDGRGVEPDPGEEVAVVGHIGVGMREHVTQARRLMQTQSILGPPLCARQQARIARKRQWLQEIERPEANGHEARRRSRLYNRRLVAAARLDPA